jgi:hypothetical protein
MWNCSAILRMRHRLGVIRAECCTENTGLIERKQRKDKTVYLVKNLTVCSCTKWYKGNQIQGDDSRYSDELGAMQPETDSRQEHVQAGSEDHPASYTTGTGGIFPGGKAAGAWSWSLTSS